MAPAAAAALAVLVAFEPAIFRFEIEASPSGVFYIAQYAVNGPFCVLVGFYLLLKQMAVHSPPAYIACFPAALLFFGSARLWTSPFPFWGLW